MQTINKIARVLPMNCKDLCDIEGFTEVKFEKYGDRVLDVTLKYNALLAGMLIVLHL